jgi:hypothetical protein
MNSFIKFIGLALLLGCAGQNAVFARARSQIFTPKADAQLTELVRKYGTDSWNVVAAGMPGKSVRQCRDRWNNYLSPDVNQSLWTEEEDKVVLREYRNLGEQWRLIAIFLPGRTGPAIRNRWTVLMNRNNRAGQSDSDVKKKSSKAPFSEVFPEYSSE